jgi:hypothetical protein
LRRDCSIVIGILLIAQAFIVVNSLSVLSLHLHVFLGSLRELGLFEVLIKLFEACMIALRGNLANKAVVLSILSIRRFDILL